MQALKLIPAALILAFAGTSAAAPTTGTITFDGSLVADTCVVNGGQNDFTVSLPATPIADLTAAAQTAGDTPFQLALTSCSPEVPVRAYFTAGSAGIADGRLNNTGLATNVQIQLLNKDAAVINLSAADAATQGDAQVITSATGEANLDYTAQYYATAATTAGSVKSNVAYEIVYN